MGCALEIGWVNKERGIVSFTWLTPLTSPFALACSLSHNPPTSPLLPSFFISLMPPTPSSPFPPASFALSSTLPALSGPSPAPFASPLPLHSCLACVPLFPLKDRSRTVVVRSVCLMQTWRALLSPPRPQPHVCASGRLWHKQVNFLTCLYNCLVCEMKSCIDCVILKPNHQHCCLESVLSSNKKKMHSCKNCLEIHRSRVLLRCFHFLCVSFKIHKSQQAVIKSDEGEAQCAAAQMPRFHSKVCADLFTSSSTSGLLHLTNHCTEHQMWTSPQRCRSNKLFISNHLQDICVKQQPLTLVC